MIRLDGRLDAIIAENAQRAPIEPCFWWRGEWWSRGTLSEMADDCTDNLRAGGFSRGDRIALVLPNSPALLATSIAAWRLGGSVVPISKNIKPSALAGYIKTLDLYAAFAAPERAALLDVMKAEGVPCAAAALDDATPMIEGATDRRPSPADTAAFFHTKGHRGSVSGVRISHKNILSLIGAVHDVLSDLDEDDVILNAIPNRHPFGFVAGGIFPLVFGIPQVLISSLISPSAVIKAMRSAGVTIAYVNPTMLDVFTSERDAPPLTKIRRLYCGGGRLSDEVAGRARRIFCVDPLAGIGSAYASGVLAVTMPDERERGPKLLSCFEGEVREGRLFVRGDAVSADSAGEDGWLDTGIDASLDADKHIIKG